MSRTTTPPLRTPSCSPSPSPSSTFFPSSSRSSNNAFPILAVLASFLASIAFIYWIETVQQQEFAQILCLHADDVSRPIAVPSQWGLLSASETSLSSSMDAAVTQPTPTIPVAVVPLAEPKPSTIVDSEFFNVTHECELSALTFPYPVTQLRGADPPYYLWLHPPHTDRWISKKIAEGGVWEKNTQMKMRQRLENEEARLREIGLLGQRDEKHVDGGIRRPIYVDIGANIGAHAMFVANLGFEVHAFEPMPHNMRLLRCSAASNYYPHRTEIATSTGTFTRQPVRPVLNMVALGEKPYDPSVPKMCMDSHEDNQGHSFLKPDSVESNNNGGTDVSSTSAASSCKTYVPLSNLDEYDRLVLKQRRITYLKIDAEGYESHILSGMNRIFAMRPPKHIYMEFSPGFLREMGRDPEQLLWTLAKHGYSTNHRDVLDAKSIAATMALAKNNAIDLWMSCMKTIFD